MNAGSLLSEVFAFEVLARCEGAALLLTEGEVRYTVEQTKKTDLVVDVDDARYGVSVVRAFVFTPPGQPERPLTPEIAQGLLEEKLADILVSSANVNPDDAWEKQILAVIAYQPDYVPILEAAWVAIDDAIRADTVVYVTTTNGDDEPLY